MAVQSKQELEQLLKKAEDKRDALKEVDRPEELFLAEIEVRKWKNLLGANETVADIPPVEEKASEKEEPEAKKAPVKKAVAEPTKAE